MGEITPPGDGLVQSFERAMAGFEHASAQLKDLLASGNVRLSGPQLQSLQEIAETLHGPEALPGAGDQTAARSSDRMG